MPSPTAARDRSDPLLSFRLRPRSLSPSRTVTCMDFSPPLLQKKKKKEQLLGEKSTVSSIKPAPSFSAQALSGEMRSTFSSLQ